MAFRILDKPKFVCLGLFLILTVITKFLKCKLSAFSPHVQSRFSHTAPTLRYHHESTTLQFSSILGKQS